VARHQLANALVILWSEPAWSLVMAWQASYQTVFLVASGLSPVTVGLAVGASGLLQAAGLTVVDTLTNRFGRKAVIMVGDFLGWVVVLGLWVLDPRPWTLVLGLILLNGTAFITPAWNSLFCEDLSSSRVTYYYLVLQLLGLLGGLAIPLLAPWVHLLGVRGSGERVLDIGWPLVIVAWLVRLVGLRESKAGQAAQHAHRSGIRAPIRQRLRMGTEGSLLTLALLRVLVRVPIELFTTLGPLVLVAVRAEALAPDLLAYLPLAGSVAGGFVMLTHGRWGRRPAKSVLVLSLALMALGMAVLSAAPSHNLAVVLLAWALVAAGQAWFWSVHTPLWVASLPPMARVTVQGWTGAGSALLVTVLAPVLAAFVEEAPRLIALLWVLPMALGLVLLLVSPTFGLDPTPDA